MSKQNLSIGHFDHFASSKIKIPRWQNLVNMQFEELNLHGII